MLKPIIGVFGEYQNGKSTFINCLLDGKYAQTGGRGTTVTSVNSIYRFGETTQLSYIDKNNTITKGDFERFLSLTQTPIDVARVEIQLWKPLLEHVSLLDTPGFNASNQDDIIAQQAFELTDIGIVIVNNRGLSEVEKGIISNLYSRGIPFYIVMNCIDIHGSVKFWGPTDEYNKKKAHEIVDYLEVQHIQPLKIEGNPVYITNLLWFWYGSGNYVHDADYQDIGYRIDEYSAKILKQKSTSADFFIDLSRFLTLKSALSNDVNWGFPLAGHRIKKTLFSAFLTWEEKLSSLRNI